jgi:hypothetical protein
MHCPQVNSQQLAAATEIMYLTNRCPKRHDEHVLVDDSACTGAPENEIEVVTPEMIRAGVNAFNENYDPDDPEGENKIVLRIFSSMRRAGPDRCVSE